MTEFVSHQLNMGAKLLKASLARKVAFHQTVTEIFCILLDIRCNRDIFPIMVYPFLDAEKMPYFWFRPISNHKRTTQFIVIAKVHVVEAAEYFDLDVGEFGDARARL